MLYFATIYLFENISESSHGLIFCYDIMTKHRMLNCIVFGRGVQKGYRGLSSVFLAALNVDQYA